MRLRSVRLSNLVFLAVLIVSAKCAKDQTAEEVIRESDHFIILTTTQLSTIEENEKVQSHAEEIYKRLVEILGEDRSPQKKITIRLEGPFIQQGPYFDPDGIHLFRYTQEEGGYLALLTHEIGHAFREAFYVANEVWNWSTYPYFDEGFSEYLAQLMEPGKTGFPFYGYPEDIVVGHMVQQGKDIPQRTLRLEHDSLNDRCNIQAYCQRASWCRYVHETYGWESLLAIIYSQREPTSEVVQDLVGVDLETIDNDWRFWTSEKYSRQQDADSIAQQFVERTSWYVYCD